MGGAAHIQQQMPQINSKPLKIALIYLSKASDLQFSSTSPLSGKQISPYQVQRAQ